MLNTSLPLMKRSIYQPAIGCSCGLHTWPTLLQSLCKLYSPINPYKPGVLFMVHRQPVEPHM